VISESVEAFIHQVVTVSLLSSLMTYLCVSLTPVSSSYYTCIVIILYLSILIISLRVTLNNALD